jgi:hypothetical protein
MSRLAYKNVLKIRVDIPLKKIIQEILQFLSEHSDSLTKGRGFWIRSTLLEMAGLLLASYI